MGRWVRKSKEGPTVFLLSISTSELTSNHQATVHNCFPRATMTQLSLLTIQQFDLAATFVIEQKKWMNHLTCVASCVLMKAMAQKAGPLSRRHCHWPRDDLVGCCIRDLGYAPWSALNIARRRPLELPRIRLDTARPRLRFAQELHWPPYPCCTAAPN